MWKQLPDGILAESASIPSGEIPRSNLSEQIDMTIFLVVTGNVTSDDQKMVKSGEE